MIRLAQGHDVVVIKQITEACAEHMQSEGIFQWNENYPSLEKITSDVAQEFTYVYEIDKKVVGSVSFSTLMDSFYQEIQWLVPNSVHLYVHRLAVHPKHQKKGIARALMDFGEDLAKQKKCLSIRLDTFSQNPRNNRFYLNRNYTPVGEVFFAQKSTAPFYCYEKLLP